MARKPSPWYDNGKKRWRVTIDGVRHDLAIGKEKETEAEADRAFMRLMLDRAGPKPQRSDIKVAEVVHLFIAHCEDAAATDKLKPLTAAFYLRHLRPFAKFAGMIRVDELKPFHVDDHIADLRAKKRKIGNTTEKGIMVSIRRCFNWAKKKGRIAANPIRDLEIPQADKRHQIVTREQAASILAAIAPGDSFRDFLFTMWHTGARPSEVMRVEARQFNPEAATWSFTRSDARKTRPDRIIHLTPEVVAICRRLAKANPSGPMFLNERGNPWTRNATACRFRRLRVKLGLGNEATAESYRHLFATDALENGVPIATVAELMGHTSTKMVSENYSHLGKRHDHLRGALSAVRGEKSA